MLQRLYRIVPLPFITLILVSGLEPVSAEETLIDAQCQLYPPINVTANCSVASFIDPAKVEIYNDDRKFWRRVDYYRRGSDRNQITRSLLYENVDCIERKIATLRTIDYSRTGQYSQIKPLKFILPEQQTGAQKNIVSFVCNLQ
ncbi:MAG TPA: hypothetical protein IGS53_19495 [Leptolyngbyaceae cyanobacterium M33_DOE_097]|uniref:Surface-adhesin protein E-like domain-containing protein n=1 Tax=Oscillatoriales cyanobacterium SpSt-418 TaxID=2282169 RepID=A0A7C3KHR7_9CYAN|nr:hypothetical protein [Leptolyngbyaceae cyanobacterium M33_DOE_097]